MFMLSVKTLYKRNQLFRSIHYSSGLCTKFDNHVFGYHPEKKSHFQLPKTVVEARSENSKIYRLIEAYRQYGHLKALTNPLVDNESFVPELEPSTYGLNPNDMYQVDGLVHGSSGSLLVSDIIKTLQKLYCGSISIEFMHLPTLEEREWFTETFEKVIQSSDLLKDDDRKRLAGQLLRSQIWDHFLSVKFQSVKRYGGEGAESLVGYFYETFKSLTKSGVAQVVLGMNHRGRLNALVEILQVNPSILFRKMQGFSEFPDGTLTSGDVLSHIVTTGGLEIEKRPLYVTMFPNPSHLEAINPVVVGKTRARQRSLKEGHYSMDRLGQPGEKAVCIQVHGDAALSGQGVVQETLALSSVPHYNIGGSIHLCTNNQIGYTTPGHNTRSSLYATDVAKISSFPVIHVNGDDPEAVSLSARLAVEYQRKFRRDVFVDMICWRRWGHNELDNPRFTNPLMYENIDSRLSVPDAYANKLLNEGLLFEEEVNAIKSDFFAHLSEEFKNVNEFNPQKSYLRKQWSGLVAAPDHVEVWDTGVDIDTLKYVGHKSVDIPKDFNLHPHLMKSFVESRCKKLSSGENIDWATGESLAMGSLLHQGFNVRISGQDVARGTFSQRHCLMVDQKTEVNYVPLNNIDKDQGGFLEVACSILSEEAVMGFEYGYSVESPNTLCIWEAQFGDFFNGAQIMIDTFVSSGEAKWMTQSGLVLILPHGFDGAGSEHSSCHLERFLQNSDSKEDKVDSERVNWNVIHPTTPAQIFHALRRQMVRNYRKPLVIAGPKTLLRLSAATSTLQDMKPGTHFMPVIGDPSVSADKVQKVIFVSGKLYYTLNEERKLRDIKNIALIRVEQLCPFPTKDINEELAKYKKAKKFIWTQEEHRNMGSWFFVSPRFRNLCGTQLTYCGREVSAATASGIGKVHKLEEKTLLDDIFNS